MWRQTPKKPELIFKKRVFILTCLNFSHLQSILHLMQYTYVDIFSTTQNSFWTRQFWCLLVLLPFFVSPLPHWQNVSLGGFFHMGKWKKKLLRVRSGEWRGWGMGVILFLVKNCWTLSVVWAGTLLNHSSWTGQMRWKSLQKKFTGAKFSWFPRTLTEQGSLHYKGPTLQKIIPGFFGHPPHKCYLTE